MTYITHSAGTQAFLGKYLAEVTALDFGVL
jgi:hypothetical protein